MLKELILREAGALMPVLVSDRRYLHRHPELSYCEHATSAYISDRLKSQGIEHVTGVAGTGIVGVIRGTMAGSGLTVGLRADMDALPLTESGSNEYRSLNEGVMHACGHDAHVAMLLGAATILNRMRDRFAGTVLLVFQPGEEKAPGGAKLMIGSGIFDSYKPDLFIAQHVLPELESGVLGFHPGPYMASCDEIYVTVAGRGGHAAQPAQYTDQIYIASEFVITLKDRMREASADRARTILGIGKITGMGATNVIPEKVEIAGTLRTFDEEWRREACDLIRQTAAETAEKHGVDIIADIVEGYPVLVNDPGLTAEATALATELMGQSRVKDMPERMSSEDFSFFATRYPSFLYRVGITPAGSEMKKLHTPQFDLDEDAMAAGTAAMTWLTLKMIGKIH